MEQSNLLDLAKQGEPDAIAALMNAVLEPKGITAHAEREYDCLNILLESPKTLNQETLTAFIQKGLLELGTDSIRTVRAQGKKLGTDSLSWTQELELYPILPNDLLWLDDLDAEPEEPEAPIELKEDSHLWLEDFEVELPAEPAAKEEVEEESEAEEESEEPPSSFFASLKIYWLAYSLPIMLVVVGAFFIGGIAAFLSTSKAAQNRVEEVMPTPDDQPPDEKQQRAEVYLKAMNTAQEKFYQQNNRFANSLEELERSANLMAQSYDYAYRLKVSDACGTAPCANRSLITASPREAGLKSYIGGVFATETGTTVPVICQTQKPSMDAPLVPEFSPKGEVSCAPRSAKVK
ncbi:MAG: type IV pilin-like G/H family protein [Myxacorys chilensis ATA2-1-KO14]|jgi:Tfp pilus assembly protein PilE|nr:type IV pilin-like G/H family protein [Myxacorys chilensis ATA2-1-KO14]